jgi:hypothetical protein
MQSPVDLFVPSGSFKGDYAEDSLELKKAATGIFHPLLSTAQGPFQEALRRRIIQVSDCMPLSLRGQQAPPFRNFPSRTVSWSF